MSPPIDFTVYEHESWRGTRWVQSYAGGDHDPEAEPILSQVAIAHATAAEDQCVVITTMPRERFDASVAHRFPEPLEAVAREAVTALLSSSPEDSEPLASMSPTLRDSHVRELQQEHARWPRTTWQIADRSVPAACQESFGGWVGFSDALPDVYVAAASTGPNLENLRISPVAGALPFRITHGKPYRLEHGC